MDWNGLIIVYSKYVLILTRLLLVVLIGLLLVTGDRFVENNLLRLEIESTASPLTDWGEKLKIRPGFEDKVVGGSMHSGDETIMVSMNDGVFTGDKAQLFLLMARAVLITHLLLGIVKSSAARDFFSSKNVRRIRIIGFSLIVYSFIEYGFEKYRIYLVDKYFESEYIDTSSLSINILPNLFESKFVIGVIVLIIAQAFDYGMKLQREQELTI